MTARKKHSATIWLVSILGMLVCLAIAAMMGCSMPEGSWQTSVSADGYYEIWADGEVMQRVDGPANFVTEGPPQGSTDFPSLRSGLPGQSPSAGRGYGFLHTDGRSIVVCPYFCSRCEQTEGPP